MAGVTIRVKIVANDNPKTIVDARPAHCEAKGPPISISAPSRSMEMPIARGNKPKPVVNVYIDGNKADIKKIIFETLSAT